MAGLIKRINLEIPGEMYNFLKHQAEIRSVSVSRILKELIEGYRSQESQRVDVKNDPLFKIGASFESGLTNLSERHDKYLYGD
ncbi:MAG: hypothetical protein V2A53_02180 [bacterium]